MKISVIIPTYNRASVISRAINSVLNQTYKDIEVIVISDGSTDETNSVVQKMQEKDTRIKLISYEESRGGNTARNIGIRNAKYDYVAFLDDDDEWQPYKLEKQIEVLKSNSNIGLVYTGVEIIYPEMNISYTTNPYLEGNLSNKILLKNYIGTTSTVVVKKSVLDISGMFDENLNAQQDYDLWIRICQSTEVGVVKEACIKYYNSSTNNQISKYTNKYKESTNYIYNKYNHLFDGLSCKEMNIVAHNSYFNIINKCLRNGNAKEARLYLKQSLKYGNVFKIFIMYIISFCDYNIILKLRSLL